MKLGDRLKFATRAIMGRKLRSGLTLLGVIIGVVLLATIFIMADSVAASVEETLVKGGANQVYVMAAKRQLTDGDRALLESIPHVSATIVYLYFDGVVSLGGASEIAPIILVEPEGLLALYPGLEAAEGIVEIGRMRCVVGNRLAKELGGVLGAGDLVQASFMGRSVSLSVSGVLKRYGFTFTGWVDMSLITSIDVAMERGALKRYSLLLVLVDHPDNVESVVDLVKELFGDAVSLFVMKDIIRQIVAFIDTITLIVGAVASVTLVVAAVGLMNAMFTAVAERTRIIGVLRALGVKRGGIASLFITEALILASLGLAIGLPIGLALGSVVVSFGGLIPFVMGRPMGVAVTIEPAHLAIVVLIPLLFSLIGAIPPAYRASKLEPDQALRYE